MLCIIPARCAKDFKVGVGEPLITRHACERHKRFFAIRAPGVRACSVGFITPKEPHFFVTINSHRNVQTDEPYPLSSVDTTIDRSCTFFHDVQRKDDRTTTRCGEAASCCSGSVSIDQLAIKSPSKLGAFQTHSSLRRFLGCRSSLSRRRNNSRYLRTALPRRMCAR